MIEPISAANWRAAVAFTPHTLELMARAGYDPRAAVTLWNKMGAAERAGTPKFLSTHPSPTDRIKDIEKNLGSKHGGTFSKIGQHA